MTVEVRPVVPDLSSMKVLPDPRPRLARCRLVVDHAAGKATWHGEGSRDEPREFRLGSGPGELAELVRAIYPPSSPYAPDTVLAGRLLLVDGEGAVLERSDQLTQVVFEQAWPFSVLDASGLPVREERFRNTRVLHKAHRGAAPMWPLTAGAGWWLLTVGTVVAVLFGVLALVVALVG